MLSTRRRRRHPLLIVGTWCRPLAQSAWRGGIEAVVFDLFADADTCRYARAAHCVASADGRHLDMQHAAALARQCAGDCDALVYAAGFESEPEHLRRIAGERAILGNAATTIHAVKDPATLGALLQRVGMPQPDTQLQPPVACDGWLVKRAGQQGGAHVAPLTAAYRADAIEGSRNYFQRHVDGMPCSALFLADRKHARIIGFSEQLTTSVGAAPYCYGGAVGHVPMPAAIRVDIEGKLHELVRAAALVGLNSLDFILAGDNYFALEINPRPSATMDLYDADCDSGLLAWHIAACAGELMHDALPAQVSRGHAVVYARRACRVPPDFAWPQWCSDVEAPSTFIAADTPLCMVHAAAPTHAQARTLLLERRQSISRILGVD